MSLPDLFSSIRHLSRFILTFTHLYAFGIKGFAQIAWIASGKSNSESLRRILTMLPFTHENSQLQTADTGLEIGKERKGTSTCVGRVRKDFIV